jgi:twinkle protein
MAGDDLSPTSAAETKVSNGPCPSCKRPKTFTTFADGHGICSKCKHYQRATEPSDEIPEADITPATSKDHRLVQPDGASWQRLDVARLESRTLRRFGYFTGPHQGSRVQVSPVHDQEGTIVAQQVQHRDGTVTLLRGGGPWVALEKCKLFGQQTFGDRFNRKLVICQTPKDAMAVAQGNGFKIAVAALLHPLAMAERDLKGNYRWIDRFDEIILFFERSPEGLRKAQECAQIFPAGKVKLAKMDAHTGPAEALKDNRPGDIETAIWSAATYRPKGIVNAKEGAAEFAETAGLLPMWPYPFQNLQARTLGMRRGEVSYHVGGTGASKTTILYQYAAWLATLPEEGHPGTPAKGIPPQMPRPKVGWLGFEDTIRSVKIGLLSAHVKQRLALKPLPKDRIIKLHEELFGSGAIELYDPENAEWGFAAIMGYLRYLIRALDCSVVVVDPLTFIIAGMDMVENERRAIDKASQELAALAKQTGAHIHVSYHLNRPDGTPHEEGARITLNHIKGSGGLAHFASNVFGYERDQQGERSDLMRVPALKVRLTGFTGANHMDYRDHQILQYAPDAGTYEETDDEWPQPKGDQSSGKRPGRKGPEY